METKKESTGTKVQIFNNTQFGNVRIVEINGKIHFVGVDVARALGYKNPNDAISRHCRGCVKHAVSDSQGFDRMTNVIPEGDLYRLAAKSELPDAEKFESWIFDEVLPAIQKHGAYMTPQTIEEALLNPDTLIQLATNLKEERKKRVEAEAKSEMQTKLINEFAPKADYYDKTLASIDTMTTTQIAKELGMSGEKLNKVLNELGVQYKVNRQWVLYAKYEDKGYTKPNTYTEIINDESRTWVSTVWTQKGREFIHSLIKQKMSA